MNESRKLWRRNFRVRALFLLIAVFAVPLGWIAYERRQIQQHREACEAIEDLGFTMGWTTDESPPQRPSWQITLFGDDPYEGSGILSFEDASSDEALKYPAALTQVYEVDLTNEAVTKAWLENFPHMPRLRVIRMGGRLVNDDALKSLRGLTHLRELNLSGASITDVGLKNLLGLTALEDVNLVGTAVSDAGITELRAALPLANVYRVEPRRNGGIF